MGRRCMWCGEVLGELVLVAVEEGGSGPGYSFYGCPACVDKHQVLPFESHPPGSMGGLRYRSRPTIEPAQ